MILHSIQATNFMKFRTLRMDSLPEKGLVRVLVSMPASIASRVRLILLPTLDSPVIAKQRRLKRLPNA